MMQARRRFLEGNHYDPMRQTVVGLCSRYLPEEAHLAYWILVVAKVITPTKLR